jgi:uncharacterized RDD family membrane protein YckC
MSVRRLTDEPLHVHPPLIGAVLASPTRRAVAFALDCILLVVPTLAVALGAVALSLSFTDPRALRAIASLGRSASSGADADKAFIRDLAPLLVRLEAPGMPPAAASAVEEGDLEHAAELLKDYNISFSLNIVEGAEKPVRPRTIVLKIEKLIPAGIRAVALLGVPALYFVLFTRARHGATIGKWLLGTRVVRLDGEPLSSLEALERFVGYLHIPGTAFLSVADLWRDPNRRLPHDRVVHTAVVRKTPAARVPRPAPVRRQPVNGDTPEAGSTRQP